jgi:galactose mutarotase-like enzyme
MLTLTNQSCQIQLSPQRGAIVTSLQVQGTEALYLDKATFEDPSKNVRGGIPVLFPLCGPQLEPAVMKQHGFARNLPWEVVEHTTESVKLLLKDTQDTRTVYPYSFRYELTYTALPDGLRIEQNISNGSESPMPLQFGFHPYFLIGEKAGLEFDLPVTTYEDNKSDDSGEFQEFDFTRDEIDWAFPEPMARTAGFSDPDRGLEFTVSYGPEYTQLVFWTLKGKPFVCLEPWSSARFAYPDGNDLHRIEPNEFLKTQIEILIRTS